MHFPLASFTSPLVPTVPPLSLPVFLSPQGAPLLGLNTPQPLLPQPLPGPPGGLACSGPVRSGWHTPPPVRRCMLPATCSPYQAKSLCTGWMPLPSFAISLTHNPQVPGGRRQGGAAVSVGVRMLEVWVEALLYKDPGVVGGAARSQIWTVPQSWAPWVLYLCPPSQPSSPETLAIHKAHLRCWAWAGEILWGRSGLPFGFEPGGADRREWPVFGLRLPSWWGGGAENLLGWKARLVLCPFFSVLVPN